jgi:UDPglucose 6-dehydrogenase
MWGLAFKPNTDDMRGAPSLDLLHMMKGEGAQVRAYDPVAMERARGLAPEVELVDDAYAAAVGADALVVVTEWNEFKNIDLPRVRDDMRRPVVIDGRNIYDPVRMDALGFVYRGVGRGYGGTGARGEAGQDPDAWRPATEGSLPQDVGGGVDAVSDAVSDSATDAGTDGTPVGAAHDGDGESQA